MAPRACMVCVLTYQQVQDISAGREVHQLGAFAKVKCKCKSKSNIIVNAPLGARSLHKVETSSFGVQAICPIAPSLGLALLGRWELDANGVFVPAEPPQGLNDVNTGPFRKLCDRLKSFYRPTLSITARCTGFNTFILSVMPYTISYFGLTTADLNRLRQASARFILKRHWLEAEILPHVLRYFGIATLLDPAVSATIAATGLYLREGNPVEDLGHQNGREECGNPRQKSVVLALMDLWSPYVGLEELVGAVAATHGPIPKKLSPLKKVIPLLPLWPRTPQALDAAIRYAANFSYDVPTPTHPHAAAFVQLPDPATRFGDIRRPTTEPPSPPPADIQNWLQSGAIRLHSHTEYQLFGAHITHLPPLLESHFFGHVSLDRLIPLLSSHPSDPQALQAAIQQFRASKRAQVEVAQIPRQPPPCGPPPPPAPPDPTSPHPKPPPPLPHSPSIPVPPPDPSTAPTSHPVTTPLPSFPHIAVPVPDPTPRSRAPRRDTDPLFPELIPGSHPPWEQRPGVTPVGAPGTTPLRPPLRPPGIPADPNEHRDIRDYNPPDPDIAKGKGKGKGKSKKGQGQGSGKGKGKPKGKEDRSSTPPPAIFAPAAKGKGKK